MPEKKQSLGFSLFVDEELYELFSLFFILFEDFSEFSNTHPDIGDGINMKEKLIEYKMLTSSMVDPVHEMGWCKDVNCQWESKKNNKKIK